MKAVARVHRFRDKVAVHVGDGRTTYLTPAAAKRLARELNRYARDVDTVPFVDSQLRGVDVSE